MVRVPVIPAVILNVEVTLIVVPSVPQFTFLEKVMVPPPRLTAKAMASRREFLPSSGSTVSAEVVTIKPEAS